MPVTPVFLRLDTDTFGIALLLSIIISDTITSFRIRIVIVRLKRRTRRKYFTEECTESVYNYIYIGTLGGEINFFRQSTTKTNGSFVWFRVHGKSTYCSRFTTRSVHVLTIIIFCTLHVCTCCFTCSIVIIIC